MVAQRAMHFENELVRCAMSVESRKTILSFESRTSRPTRRAKYIAKVSLSIGYVVMKRPMLTNTRALLASCSTF
jgi:DNA repair photolyase